MNMDVTDYKSYWDAKAGSEDAALAAVDNSGSEDTARVTGRWTADLVRAAIDLQPGDSVLELGCGAGRIGREMAADCAQWIGTDISPRMLEVAAKRLVDHGNVRLEALNRTALEMFEPASIDKAYTVAVLCHMDKEDLFLYLREMARVLKPGGLAYLETWNLADATGWYRWMYEVEHWNRSDQSQRKYVSRNQFCVPQEFRFYAERAGFQIIGDFHDSPWCQLVVGRGLGDAALEAQRRRVAADRGRIANSPLFGQLFGQAVRVIYGEDHPQVMLDALDAMPPVPEVDLFRTYVLGLWQGNRQQWGEPPESAG